MAAYRAATPKATWSRLRRLANAELGRNDSRQRWYQYRHGLRPIPVALQHWLLSWALYHALLVVPRVRLARSFITAMAPYLTPPSRS